MSLLRLVLLPSGTNSDGQHKEMPVRGRTAFISSRHLQADSIFGEPSGNATRVVAIFPNMVGAWIRDRESEGCKLT